MSTLRITGGRVIDPANDVDTVADVWVQDGRIAAITSFITRSTRSRDETDVFTDPRIVR